MPPGNNGPHLPPAGGMEQPYPSGAYVIDPGPGHPMQHGSGGFPQATGPQVAFGPQSTGPHPYPPAPHQTGPHAAFPPVPTGQHVAFPPVPTGQHSAFPPVRTGQYGPPRTKRPTKPPRPAANRILVIAASALLVAVFGGAAYIVFGGLSNDDDEDSKPLVPTKPAPAGAVDGSGGAAAGSSAAGTMTPTATPIPTPAPAPTSPTTTSPTPTPTPTSPPTTTGPGDGSGTSPGNTAAVHPAVGSAGSCMVDVASNPAGAEIVLDTTVLGVTPAQVPLPCDAPVKLLVRKASYVAQQRAVTPARDGSDKLKITLVHVSYSVKVSSSPPGATITMNGKSLGTTPATIKLPAFEAAVLTITKDGFSTETEHVTPKTNNTTVHSILKKAAPPKRLK